MPIYAYACGACGFKKDVLQKLSDAPLTDCPSCGQPQFSKQLTAPGFVLKGSGWYVTDFREGQKKPSDAAAGAADASGSESKPAADAPAAEAATSSAGSTGSTGSNASQAAPAPTPSAAVAPATAAAGSGSTSAKAA
ncbi:MAG: FmdB family zinc ribbon protein [Burkholderiaceae bacterium]